MTEDLFSDFPHTSAQQWMEQIIRDLKGRTPDDMTWSPDGELKINPYVHAEDVSGPMPALDSFGQWQIGERFEVSDPADANQQIRVALNGGVESLLLQCQGDADWVILLNEVQLPLVQLTLDFTEEREDGLARFIAFAEKQAVLNDLQISVTGKAADVHDSIRFCTRAAEDISIVRTLTNVLFQAGADSDWRPEHLEGRDLMMRTGHHYLVEIARLRALRILWQNLAEALKFNIPSGFSISVQTAPGTGADPYQHMIRSAFMGTAAVLGGADCVYISPAEGGDRSVAFYRHIARNVSHLLRYESKFTEIPDPVAGAYYIDELTKEIVEKAWEELKERLG